MFSESASSSTSSNLGSPLARPPPIPSSPPPEDHMESSSSSQSAASPAQCQSQQGSSPSPQGGSGLPFTVEPGQPLAIWVASTFDSIPPNAMIINPQTGKGYKLVCVFRDLQLKYVTVCLIEPSGFVQVLEILESPWISKNCFPGLEGPGILM